MAELDPCWFIAGAGDQSASELHNKSLDSLTKKQLSMRRHTVYAWSTGAYSLSMRDCRHGQHVVEMGVKS
jgi:hypothetical protein